MWFLWGLVTMGLARDSEGGEQVEESESSPWSREETGLERKKNCVVRKGPTLKRSPPLCCVWIAPQCECVSVKWSESSSLDFEAAHFPSDLYFFIVPSKFDFKVSPNKKKRCRTLWRPGRRRPYSSGRNSWSDGARATRAASRRSAAVPPTTRRSGSSSRTAASSWPPAPPLTKKKSSGSPSGAPTLTPPTWTDWPPCIR